jgi:hypothetical protein
MSWLKSAEEMVAERVKQAKCEHEWSPLGPCFYVNQRSQFEFICYKCERRMFMDYDPGTSAIKAKTDYSQWRGLIGHNKNAT